MSGWLAVAAIPLAALVFAAWRSPEAVALFLRVFGKTLAAKFPVAVLTLWFVASLVFLLAKAAGGDEYLVGEGRIDPLVLQATRERLGLDQPLHIQYVRQMRELVRLNTGPSVHHNSKTLRDLLGDHLPVSAGLGIRALVLAIVFGVLIGILCSVWHNGLPDQGGKALALLGVSVPNFILATLAVYYLARRWELFPASEWTGWGAMWVPAACLGAFPFAAILRLTRASMLEALREDYVRTARAKGVAEWRVITSHALRNSLSSVVTYIGPVTAALLTGSLVVERIFSLPGIGDLLVASVGNRDMPLVLGITALYSALLIFMNLLVDSLYPVLNPRLRDS